MTWQRPARRMPGSFAVRWPEAADARSRQLGATGMKSPQNHTGIGRDGLPSWIRNGRPLDHLEAAGVNRPMACVNPGQPKPHARLPLHRT